MDMHALQCRVGNSRYLTRNCFEIGRIICTQRVHTTHKYPLSPAFGWYVVGGVRPQRFQAPESLHLYRKDKAIESDGQTAKIAMLAGKGESTGGSGRLLLVVYSGRNHTVCLLCLPMCELH